MIQCWLVVVSSDNSRADVTSVESGVTWQRTARCTHTNMNTITSMKDTRGHSMGNTTTGEIALNEVLPLDNLDEIVENYYDWYEGIDPQKQEIADRIFTPIIENLDESAGQGTVKYSINKIPGQAWNMLAGGQYQINKHFQVRAEGGFIGRKSILVSFNYRFGIKHNTQVGK